MTTQKIIPTPSNEFVPGDDASVAKHLAEVYRSKGLDPNSAYDNPVEDFGGPGAFI